MSKSVPVSVRLQPETNEELARVATSMDRPKSWIIEKAVKDYLELQAWQLAAIDAGIADADAGNLVPHEDVVAWVNSWGTEDELPMPE
jgi:predicted transcriptional regulator